MRFFHISDLHIGKQLGGFDLSEDLRHVLFSQVLGSAYEQYKPDALIIAGDIYDRAAPSAEGTSLFDELLSRAGELKLPVYAISGNHDSAQRVAYGRQLFENSGVYISAPFSAETPVTLYESGDIDIALLPYISAEMAQKAYPDEEIESMTDALEAVFRHAEIPREGRPCVLVAHQAVADESASPIGKLENADYRIFAPFAYTALGHFHTPRFVGGPRVRYCGSPVCFSAKEAERPQKYLDIIDIDSEGNAEVENIPLLPLRAVRVIEDSFQNIISDRYAPSEDFVFIAVEGDNAELDVARRITAKFPNCVSIRYQQKKAEQTDMTEYRELEFSELFSGFFREVTGEDISESLLETAEELFRQAEKEADR